MPREMFGNTKLITKDSNDNNIYWSYRTAFCPECRNIEIDIVRRDGNGHRLDDWRQVYPIGASRGPVPSEVPQNIAQDYIEACNVLPISAKASAALSRRCLQNMLHAAGYKSKDLAKAIDLLLEEKRTDKALPHRLRVTVDAIRNFGNFSAHPIDDKTTLQVIDVEPEEADWCLEIIEDMFEHFYVGPEAARVKKAALDAKLVAGGKPASKGA
ncbi:DUF4145 domain-containing protein [Bradyrhizobium sp. AUGA SZCCT0042]|uniref:DUF4145 domain-containing protein n=1 Tax=Bradyrhizobium sp. AUGA SZCCT0042 TaxID=2807651 RepID=UPI001BA58934|nr:DUF4145 domain-containing protein [Bradyrhizobium sp. AUGA SZCCT0042]MBR1297422.1 DUF4145 domain-containing protein [Bradyrhizobium sp. AUGA SZCCT0042]